MRTFTTYSVFSAGLALFLFLIPALTIAQQNPQEAERIDGIDEILSEHLNHEPEEDRINVYVFSDYDCPHCRDLKPRLNELEENYDEVALYYIPYPALQREHGIQAAIATLCADNHGYREEFSTYMAENWSDVDSEKIEHAHEQFDDIDSGEWQSCMTDDATRMQQNEIINAGQELQISSVPTTIIDGYVISGGVNYDTLEDIVEQVR